MFESDDFDQVLSQFDFPEVDDPAKKTNPIADSTQPNILLLHTSNTENIERHTSINRQESILTSSKQTPIKENCTQHLSLNNDTNSINQGNCTSYIEKLSNNCVQSNSQSKDNFISPKHMKRKIINSHFDCQSKRKFPGPAGILTGALEEAKDDSICQIELLSQDIDFTQQNLQNDIFESPIWKRLSSDSQAWHLKDIDSIKTIKHQALAGNLRRRKAQTVTAFVEAVDRSVIDPLIILRDQTGSIKCTLHRDAWSKLASYIVSDYCAVILQRPTVLTTGGAFKKHYLNITLGNILAVYSSAVLNEDKMLPDGYSVVYEEDFTVIKAEKLADSLGTSALQQTNGAEDLFDCLDNIFSDDLF